MIKVVAITGAGLSVDSGIRPYRGPTGIYTELEETYGVPVEELLTRDYLVKHPEKFWEYWTTMALNVADVEPNAGHRSLVRIAELTKFLEITQNVDGLSAKAGLAEECLIELHGSGRRYYCNHCVSSVEVSITEHMGVPECPQCTQDGRSRLDGCPQDRSIVRPAVVLFNEFIDIDHWARIIDACTDVDVLLMVGTTSMFPYINHAKQMASSAGATVIVINPDDIEPDRAVVHWKVTAAEGLERFVNHVEELIGAGIPAYLLPTELQQRLQQG